MHDTVCKTFMTNGNTMIGLSTHATDTQNSPSGGISNGPAIWCEYHDESSLYWAHAVPYHIALAREYHKCETGIVVANISCFSTTCIRIAMIRLTHPINRISGSLQLIGVFWPMFICQPYICQLIRSLLAHVMAWRMFGAQPSPQPIPKYH